MMSKLPCTPNVVKPKEDLLPLLQTFQDNNMASNFMFTTLLTANHKFSNNEEDGCDLASMVNQEDDLASIFLDLNETMLQLQDETKVNQLPVKPATLTNPIATQRHLNAIALPFVAINTPLNTLQQAKCKMDFVLKKKYNNSMFMKHP